MLTFDFQCTKCKHIFEFTRPFGSEATPVCPACQSKKTEKLIAPPAVHFKGTGWYKTDSRKEKGTKVIDGTKGATPENKSETKKETGTEKTTEKKKEATK